MVNIRFGHGVPNRSPGVSTRMLAELLENAKAIDTNSSETVCLKQPCSDECTFFDWPLFHLAHLDIYTRTPHGSWTQFQHTRTRRFTSRFEQFSYDVYGSTKSDSTLLAFIGLIVALAAIILICCGIVYYLLRTHPRKGDPSRGLYKRSEGSQAWERSNDAFASDSEDEDIEKKYSYRGRGTAGANVEPSPPTGQPHFTSFDDPFDPDKLQKSGQPIPSSHSNWCVRVDDGLIRRTKTLHPFWWKLGSSEPICQLGSCVAWISDVPSSIRVFLLLSVFSWHFPIGIELCFGLFYISTLSLFSELFPIHISFTRPAVDTCSSFKMDLSNLCLVM